MTTATGCAPYDSQAWRSVSDRLFRPGGFALTDRAIALSGLPRGSRVWDIGCGLGLTVERLIAEHALDAEGVDWSRDLVRAARERSPWLPVHCADGTALPCPTGALDGVILECSWSAMSGRAADGTPDPILAECRRVLRYSGRLAITDMYARAPAPSGRAPLGGACWSAMPTEREVLAALARHGFTVDLWEDHSLALREFTARLILEHGSLAPLLGDDVTRPEARAALAAARPGYFLLIARRN